MLDPLHVYITPTTTLGQYKVTQAGNATPLATASTQPLRTALTTLQANTAISPYNLVNVWGPNGGMIYSGPVYPGATADHAPPPGSVADFPWLWQ